MYYIFSAKHTHGYTRSFWRPDGKGYTIDLNDAGLYTIDQHIDYPVWDGKDKVNLRKLIAEGQGNVRIHKDNIEKLGRKMACILN